MKNSIIFLLFGALMVTGTAYAKGYGKGGNGQQQGAYMKQIMNSPAPPLTSEDKQGLILMREEEKLARDVYQALYNRWQHRIFSNIAQSEQQHMNTVKLLLDKYGIKDPVADEYMKRGTFQNAELQKVYDALIQKGSQSLMAAMEVGATIEDLDIKDLNDLLAQTSNRDITTVYRNLVKGSRNHLRSFTGQMANGGARYKAQYLTQQEVDTIISSPRERGPAAI